MKLVYLCGSPNKEESLSSALIHALDKKLPEHEGIFLDTLDKADDIVKYLDELRPHDKAGALVIAFPLYFDGLPACLTGSLEVMSEKMPERESTPDQAPTPGPDLSPGSDATFESELASDSDSASGLESKQDSDAGPESDSQIKVYTIINCAFYESENMENAADMIRLWCKAAGLSYKGALLIGGGAAGIAMAGEKGQGSRVDKSLISLADAIIKNDDINKRYVKPKKSKKAYLKARNKDWFRAAKKYGKTVEDLLGFTVPE